MSKYFETQFTLQDRDCLVAALESLFGKNTVEVGTDLHLYGYNGDRRSQTADIVVRRQHISYASNDLGFRRTENGYAMTVSEFDRGELRLRFGDFQDKLKLAYAEEACEVIALRLRGTVSKRQESDATVWVIAHG